MKMQSEREFREEPEDVESRNQQGATGNWDKIL